jgi:hypothetical protein
MPGQVGVCKALSGQCRAAQPPNPLKLASLGLRERIGQGAPPHFATE